VWPPSNTMFSGQRFAKEKEYAIKVVYE